MQCHSSKNISKGNNSLPMSKKKAIFLFEKSLSSVNLQDILFTVNVMIFNCLCFQKSKQLLTGREMTFNIYKKESVGPFWPRLLKQKGKVRIYSLFS